MKNKYQDQCIQQRKMDTNRTISSQYTFGGIQSMERGHWSSIFVSQSLKDLRWCKNQISKNPHLSMTIKKELYKSINEKKPYLTKTRLNLEKLQWAYSVGNK